MNRTREVKLQKPISEAVLVPFSPTFMAMTNQSSPPEAVDADLACLAANQILKHLGRCGVRMLPRAVESGIDTWQERMRMSGPEVAETIPPVPAAPVKRPPLPPIPSKPTTMEAAAAGRLLPVPPMLDQSTVYPGVALPVADRMTALRVLSEAVAGCTRCPVLTSCRTQTVFGEGNPTPRFVFFGEGPGADEDRTGRPFVGRAGQLLDKMIQACRLRREDVYIMNTVKCRPPENRNPEDEEIENCREFFEQQLQVLRPEYIVCLGAISSRALLRSKLGIGRLRQQFHRYHESKVLVIYHPAYLLRAPDAKKAAWADLQMLMADAGL